MWHSNVSAVEVGARGAILALLLFVSWPVAGAEPGSAMNPPGPVIESELPGLKATLPALRAGGLVVFFRHSTTDQSGSEDDTADLARCETQRNLSAEGRAQALQIGKAIKELGINIGNVSSSPFCRCVDTAMLAFGKRSINNDLYFSVKAEPAERQRLVTGLRTLLGNAPAKGVNDVIVAHTANLKEAANLWPKPEGVAFVFRPMGDGRFEPIAKVLPDEWLAASQDPALAAPKKAANAKEHL